MANYVCVSWQISTLGLLNREIKKATLVYIYIYIYMTYIYMTYIYIYIGHDKAKVNENAHFSSRKRDVPQYVKLLALLVGLHGRL